MKIAIVGASGAVGREMIEELENSSLQDIELFLFASPRSEGQSASFRGKNITIRAFAPDLLKGIPWVLMSAGGAFSKEHSRGLVERGCTVIDNSSAWRMDSQVALIVPEVNGDVLREAKGPRIIANPNCSTIQMVVALKPLEQAFGIDMVQVATYQSVSGSGQKGISELSSQLDKHLRFQEITPQLYAQPIAFNVLAAIDKLDDAGHCYEEEKMVRETRKILGREDMQVLATTVRVPVFHCHSESIAVRLKRPVTLDEAVRTLQSGEGMTVVHPGDHSNFPTPRSVTGDPGVWVSRVRLPLGAERSEWLQFWVVADNLKKGAATNAVQILQKLVS